LRYRLDPEFNLRQKLRTAFRRKRQGIKIGQLLRDALVRNGGSPTAEAFVGYSIATLKVHLERQFKPSMSWAAFCAGHIHIDHIVPLSSFNLRDVDELRRAWALTNLRPEWRALNLRKGGKRLYLL